MLSSWLEFCEVTTTTTATPTMGLPEQKTINVQTDLHLLFIY